jgi:ribosomal protein S18 acetylase RimI-like enzyme
MKLIQCNPSYWEFVRNLRNDPNNLHGFINNKYITTEDQITYMTKYNDNYYICLDNNNLPLGFIGNIDGDMRICVKNDRQNQGIGTFMTKEFLMIQQKNTSLIAKVKITNIASQKLFKKVGFKPAFIIYTKE